MAEYIEREALMRRIKEIHCAECDSYHGVRCRACWVDDTLDYIDSEPAADVAPVRHGRWISLTECANEGVYCSICKKKVWKSDYALCSHKSRNKLRSDYCPNCGAKMDGGDGNSDMV